MKESSHQLSLDPSYRSSHYLKIRFLTTLQAELLKEKARISATLVKIQGMILQNMDALKTHIAHAKTLIHDNNVFIDDHMMELSAEAQIVLHASKVLQENWDKKMALILKIHSEFLSHFGIII